MGRESFGSLMLSTDGENFNELGKIVDFESLEIEPCDTKIMYPDIPVEISTTLKITQREWKKVQKALGIYKYTFKKIRKGKRMVRLVI